MAPPIEATKPKTFTVPWPVAYALVFPLFLGYMYLSHRNLRDNVSLDCEILHRGFGCMFRLNISCYGYYVHPKDANMADAYQLTWKDSLERIQPKWYFLLAMGILQVPALLLSYLRFLELQPEKLSPQHQKMRLWMMLSSVMSIVSCFLTTLLPGNVYGMHGIFAVIWGLFVMSFSVIHYLLVRDRVSWNVRMLYMSCIIVAGATSMVHASVSRWHRETVANLWGSLAEWIMAFAAYLYMFPLCYPLGSNVRIPAENPVEEQEISVRRRSSVEDRSMRRRCSVEDRSMRRRSSVEDRSKYPHDERFRDSGSEMGYGV